MPTDTVHITTCPTAVALAAPTAQSGPYAAARRHSCVYRASSLPANVKVTTVDGVVPPKA